MRKFPKYEYPIKLNIGCGKDDRKGFINIDFRDLGFNMIWDIRGGIPFPDGSVDEIFASHFVEHLDDEECQDFFVDAMRVLKPHGGLLVVRCPHFQSVGAFYMGHKSFWNTARVEALTRFDKDLGLFVITENKIDREELHFTIRKS